MGKWDKADGFSFEAELITISAGEAGFKSEKGAIIRVPLAQLSESSRTRAELANPPRLSIDIIKDYNAITFPSGIRDVTQHPPERRAHYGMRIKQTSSGDYNHPLNAELFVIGRERLGDRLILFDRQSASFHLTRENRREFEFRSERVVRLRNYLMWDQPRGEDYFGYLIVVSDIQSNTVSVSSSHDFLYENLDNLKERYINNYMDETCIRVFPTRPPHY